MITQFSIMNYKYYDKRDGKSKDAKHPTTLMTRLRFFHFIMIKL